MSRNFNWIYVLFLVFVFVSCESVKREPFDASSVPDDISFEMDIAPRFEAKCTQCHGGTTPPNLSASEAYFELTAGGYINTLSPAESKLYKAIDVGGGMYQYASDEDRAYILKWIETGALDN